MTARKRVKPDSRERTRPTARQHWEAIYSTKPEDELSWHQDEPSRSLALLRRLARAESRIVDIGGGSSPLAGRLVDAGFRHVAVLDVSEAAIARNKKRIGARARRILWINSDLTEAESIGRFDLWHDRAVFHFLTRASDRERYLRLAARTVPIGGHVVIATFALDGPEQCSGLPVERYDSRKLAEVFQGPFELRDESRESHTTPWGSTQRFTYATLLRVAASGARRRGAASSRPPPEGT